MTKLIIFELSDILDACKHLSIDPYCDLWLESTPNVVYLRFCLYTEEIEELIKQNKGECVDFIDAKDQWHDLSDLTLLPSNELVSCRYILQTT